jgi:hypothetical protein
MTQTYSRRARFFGRHRMGVTHGSNAGNLSDLDFNSLDDFCQIWHLRSFFDLT